ncbi:MAG: DMT family transporter [Eubacterium sp.]|nr:DMT family transporter [Eubacterium sp.]
MPKSKAKRNSFILVLAAFIWGIAFVAQTQGGAIGPYAFTSIRYFIGGAVLLPVIAVIDKISPSSHKPKTKKDYKTLISGGICCGVSVAAASILQQVGIYRGTSAGKAGFLTACYIILVPIFGIFLKRKCGLNVWASVFIALAGLYLLCIKKGEFSVEKNDIIVLLCSAMYAVQILFIDRFLLKGVDSVRLACVQFFVCSAVAAIPGFFIDSGGSFSALPELFATAFSGKTLIAILYTGVLSSGVAYTLQIVGQKDVNPTVASLLMSLESVFSVLGGWLILGDLLTVRELAGCGIMFLATVLSQLPADKLKNTTKKGPG